MLISLRYAPPAGAIGASLVVNKIFTSKFEALATMCSETTEFGYDMLWQGEPEG